MGVLTAAGIVSMLLLLLLGAAEQEAVWRRKGLWYIKIDPDFLKQAAARDVSIKDDMSAVSMRFKISTHCECSDDKPNLVQ